MALNKEQLKEGVKTLMSEMRTREDNADDEFADRLATLVDAYVKTAAINYTNGLIAPSGGGPVTGTFIGTLQ